MHILCVRMCCDQGGGGCLQRPCVDRGLGQGPGQVRGLQDGPCQPSGASHAAARSPSVFDQAGDARSAMGSTNLPMDTCGKALGGAGWRWVALLCETAASGRRLCKIRQVVADRAVGQAGGRGNLLHRSWLSSALGVLAVSVLPHARPEPQPAFVKYFLACLRACEHVRRDVFVPELTTPTEAWLEAWLDVLILGAPELPDCLIVVPVRHPVAGRYQPDASQELGSTARAAETEKSDRYPPACGRRVWPGARDVRLAG